MKKEKETLAVYVQKNAAKRDREYGTLSLGIVRVEDGGKIRNPGYDHPYNDLTFDAQWRVESPTEPTYGWEAKYRNVYSVGLQRAKRMYKTLQKVEKVRGKSLISPTTFGQYVALMAHALGINKVIRQRTPSGNGDYDGGEYSTYGLDMAQTIIDGLISEARKVEEEVKTA